MSGDTLPEVRESVPLGPFTTLGLGGPARWFVTATDPSQVANAHAWCRARNVPLFAIGGGSNLVIAEEGVDGLVLRMAITGITLEPQADGSTRVTAGAGESWDDVVAACLAADLAGVECLSGIPGTVGGTPIQNVGAYGQEVSDSIESVAAFDVRGDGDVNIPATNCGFSYRMSRFKSEPGRFIVTSVTFRLKPGAPTVRYPDLLAWIERAGIAQPTLEDVRRAVIAIRRTKGMIVDVADSDSCSVGSFFMNPVVTVATRDAIAGVAGQTPPSFGAGGELVKVPAAWLIERAGFQKGHVDGRVGISTKHPLALVNRGGATARDVLRLANHIKHEVAGRFGVFLRPEPIFLGFDGDPAVAYLVRTE
jgi:UDP-N-acetylmuramate dehydrogenase